MAKDNIAKQLTINVSEFAKSINSAGKSVDGLSKTVLSFGNAVSKGFSVAGIIAWIGVIKEATNLMINASKKQTEYIESLNLLNNAYGDVNNSGKELINTISEFTGFDQSGLTKSLGSFRQISSALGIANDSANTLSENLLKMQMDVASLYNLELDVAGNKLISAITGQSRAVKVLGADITDAGLQVTAFSLGIEKSVKNMSQAEKTVLRYVTLQNQLKNSQGDLGRTINSVANQTKIWKDQITMLGRQLGGFLIPILQGLLPLLNGILMAVNELIGRVLKLFGIDANSLADSFGTAKGQLEEFNDGLEHTSSAAKAAKTSLRGFDKLNVIQTPKSSGGGGGLGGGISSEMLKAITEYNNKLSEAKNYAHDVKEKILGWLGATETLNKVFGPFLNTMKKIYEFAKKLIKTLSSTFVDKISPKIGEIYNNVVGGLTNIGNFWNSFWTDIGAGVDTWGGPIIDGLSTLFGSILEDIIIPVVTQITEIWNGITTTISELWDEYGAPLVDKVGETISGIIELFQHLYDSIIKPIVEPLFKEIKELWSKYMNPLLKEIGSFIAKLIEFVLDIWNQVVSPIISFLADILSPVIVATVNWIKDVLSTFFRFFSSIFKDIFQVLGGVIDFITGVFSGDWKKAWEGIKNIFKGLWDGLVNLFKIPINLIIDGINFFINGLNKIKIPDWVPAVGGKGFHIEPIKKLAEGGFVNEGEVFVAREAGPELVGSVNGKTAVANNDQIVEAISVGVAKAMMATNKSTNVTIEATGDTNGLLSFINFKQKEQERQYGL